MKIRIPESETQGGGFVATSSPPCGSCNDREGQEEKEKGLWLRTGWMEGRKKKKKGEEGQIHLYTVGRQWELD